MVKWEKMPCYSYNKPFVLKSNRLDSSFNNLKNQFWNCKFVQKFALKSWFKWKKEEYNKFKK